MTLIHVLVDYKSLISALKRKECLLPGFDKIADEMSFGQWLTTSKKVMILEGVFVLRVPVWMRSESTRYLIGTNREVIRGGLLANS